MILLHGWPYDIHSFVDVAPLLAAEGFTASKRAIEAPRGFANVLATERDYGEITKSAYTMIMIGRDEAHVEEQREKLSRYIPRRGASIGTPAALPVRK